MEHIAPYDARAVANLILDLADERGVQLTQMQLLKIVYFAHGWFLAANKKPLVKQNFEAWEYGPVVRVVRDAFKHFGKSPITDRAEILDIFTGECTSVPPVACYEHVQFITSIFLSYHSHGAWQLSEMTHEEGSPWDKVWNSPEPIGRLGLRISEREIRSHFEQIPDRILRPH